MANKLVVILNYIYTLFMNITSGLNLRYISKKAKNDFKYDITDARI